MDTNAEYTIARYRMCGSRELKNIWYKNQLLYVTKTGEAFIFINRGREYLVPVMNTSGYLCLKIKEHKDNTFDDYGLLPLHTILMYSWIGLPPSWMKNPTVEHKNQHRLENYIENLCWMERRDNQANRLFGNRNAHELERMEAVAGNKDWLYKVRDTRLRTRRIKDRIIEDDLDVLYNEGLEDLEEE